MILKILLLACVVACVVTLSSCIGAGDNSPITTRGATHFPRVSGIDLHGTTYELPEAFDGELQLVIVAFEREHQADVNSWVETAELLEQKLPPLAFYEVPLIYELSTPYRFWAE